MCDDPRCMAHGHTDVAAGLAAIDAKLRHDLRTTGWAMVGVLAEPPYAYTVGLTDKKLPELYAGTDLAGMHGLQELLNKVAAYLVDHPEDARHGKSFVIAAQGHEHTMLLEARLDRSKMPVANRKYNGRFRALTVTSID